jgi:hypothetical protein
VFLSGDLLFNFKGKPQKLLPQSRGEKGEKKKTHPCIRGNKF